FAVFLFFFFQAEDGIRDWSVTGVQTCALPISCPVFYHLFVQLHRLGHTGQEIGRASCRERVEISVVAVSLKKKKKKNTTQVPESTKKPSRQDSGEDVQSST